MSLHFNYTKIASLLLMSLLVWACEKDQTNPNTLSNNTISENSQPHKGLKNQKSTLFESIQEYEDSLLTSSYPETIEREDALLYMESIINHNEADASEVGNLSEEVTFEVGVNISENSQTSELEIQGDDALSFYNSIEADLEDAYEGSDLYEEHGADAYIAVVDLDIPSSGSGTGTESVGVAAQLKVVLSPAFSDCSSQYDWKALNLLGTCTGSYSGVFDAARKLEGMLNDADCNSDKFERMCTSVYFYSIASASSSGLSSSNIWNGTSPSDCLTAIAINNTHFPNYKSEANSITSSISQKTFIDYQVKGIEGVGTNVAHNLKVQYASQIFHPCDL